MNTGYLAAFATLFAWTISNFALAKLTRLTDSFTLNKAALFFSIFLLGSLVCILDKLWPWQLFTVPNKSNWIWLGISGILGKSIGDYMGFRAMRILGVRRRSMISTLGPGFTWVFGLIILDEKMNWIGIIAMFITIIALLLLITSTAEKEEVKKENFGLPLSGLLFGIGAAALTGLAFILSKLTFVETGRKISEFHGTWIRIIAAFFPLLFIDFFRSSRLGFIREFLTDKKKAYLLFVVILFGSALGLSLSLVAITRINAAAAYTVFSMVPVTVIFTGLILHKKRMAFQSWIYSALAVAGVLVMVWRDALIKYF